ncbi:hypothetical protein H5410_015296 [Solanum commersonii]|uniref:DUF1985 domain-containing protein n=1 Tax=Solanum commersonii TaxID=4109 RepID=A0A9J5ZTF9_SOLCO|nr:hypothetical protein H5410_015296 [Solanum commersonii]
MKRRMRCLKCHSHSQPIPIFTVKNNSEDESKERHKQVMNRYIKEAHRVIVLTWFVHNVLIPKDVNNNIPLNWMKFFEDIEAFNNYHWGHDNYKLTVKYLLAPLSPKINSLFGFPWAFMVNKIFLSIFNILLNNPTFDLHSSFEEKVTTKEEVSSPRMLRWLTTKNIKNPPNLFNPPNDASNAATNKTYVSINEPSIATYASYVAIYHLYVSTFEPSVTTCQMLLQMIHVYLHMSQKRYELNSEEVTKTDGKSLKQLLDDFVWDDDSIDYVRGYRPYPGGIDWIGTKRVISVMNIDKNYFILLHEGHMNVYDCNMMVYEHSQLFYIHTTCVRVAANIVDA